LREGTEKIPTAAIAGGREMARFQDEKEAEKGKGERRILE